MTACKPYNFLRYIVYPVTRKALMVKSRLASEMNQPSPRDSTNSGDLCPFYLERSMNPPKETASRGHKKRERTRIQLLNAGIDALAQKGDGFTISDVVNSADVSSGTFYNYFADRAEFISALAGHALTPYQSEGTAQPSKEDPVRRLAMFAYASLKRGREDPDGSVATLRLAEDDNRIVADLFYKRVLTEITAGFEQGRFTVNPDETAVDQIIGFMRVAIRRIARGAATPDYPQRAVERALVTLGLSAEEAKAVAIDVIIESDKSSEPS